MTGEPHGWGPRPQQPRFLLTPKFSRAGQTRNSRHPHRRRIRTEEKAKVVAAVLHWMILIIGWLYQDDLKEKDEFILFFKIVIGKIASAAKNWIHFYPQIEATTNWTHSSPKTESTTFAFSSVFIYPSSMASTIDYRDRGPRVQIYPNLPLRRLGSRCIGNIVQILPEISICC